MELDRIIEALRRPEAYPHSAHDLREHHTHISVVFLAGDLAYKLKKPVDLGFLDFTTLERRRHFCRQEVRLNRRLAPGVYRGVVPVVSSGDRIRVAPDEGAVAEQESVVEYAVKMERLPPEATLKARLERSEVETAHVDLVARRVAEFHRRADAGPEIARYGRWEVVARNARENFQQTEGHVGATVSEEVHARLSELTEAHLRRLRPLVEARARAEEPRDTHGDLHLEHVYLFPEREPPRDLLVVDCIEFNDRFRYADPVSDMAFLAMDLKRHGRRDLSTAFAEAYFEARAHEGGRPLLPFYVAYRAAVRGKVEGMTAVDPDVPEEERAGALAEARAHWLLSLGELAPPGQRPCLVLVGGLPGTGKSTLARALERDAGFRRLSSDRTRKELAGLEPSASARAGFERGIYAPEWTRRTYGALLRESDELLFHGERVVVDASFRSEAHRLEFLGLAERRGVPFLFLRCRAGSETVRRRLVEREARDGEPGPASAGASDADLAVYTEAARRWEERGAEVGKRTREVDTEGTPAETLEQAIRLLTSLELME